MLYLRRKRCRDDPGQNDQLLRLYAAGEISWTLLRGRGFDNYRDMLAGLGRLHLAGKPGQSSGRPSSRGGDDMTARAARHRRLAADDRPSGRSNLVAGYAWAASPNSCYIPADRRHS